MPRISYKKEKEKVEAQLREANAKLEHLQGFKHAVEAMNSSYEKSQQQIIEAMKENSETQEVFQKKIIRIEKIHYVVAICIAIFTSVQTILFFQQNERINVQNSLMEAERRSNLLFHMSNIMDKVDEEIKSQKDEFPDRKRYKLSKPLIGRIIALSRAFKPYFILNGDTLESKLSSPERSQLLNALAESHLDSSSFNSLISKGDFSHTVLNNYNFPEGNHMVSAAFENANFSNTSFDKINLHLANFSGANLKMAKFPNADLSSTDFYRADLSSAYLIKANFKDAFLQEADLSNAFIVYAFFANAKLIQTNLSNTTLHHTDFSMADLSETDFRGADIRDAILRNADLFKADLRLVIHEKKLDVKLNQWLQPRRLFKCKGLDPKFEALLLREKPCLFTEEGCPIEEN